MSGARRILVTGASGFIGRHALAPLRARGFEVHAVARKAPKATNDAPDGVHWHSTDLLAPGGAHALLADLRPTHLLHFAWYAEHGKFWSAPVNADWLEASRRLFRDFIAAGGRRFVGAGTCAEYDWSEAAAPLDEESTPLHPATPYGQAKASAFRSGMALAKEAGLAFCWGRIFHLFGPRENPARLVPSLIRAHLRRESLDCGPAGKTHDFLSAAAIAEAFAHLCAADVEGPINIGSGEPLRLDALSKRIAALAGSRGDIRFGARQGSGPERLVPAVRRLHASGWAQPRPLESDLADAVAWWRDSAGDHAS